MFYRRLDENGDYSFGHGKSSFASDIEAVAQAIETKIKLFKGEFWYDVQDGTPMFQDILGQKLSNEGKNAIDIIITDRILKIPEVSTVLSYSSEIDKINRTYNAVIVVETIYGTLEVEV